MLFSGTINTISSKFQDDAVVVGLPDSKPHEFNHPAVQTLSMFMGETLCLFVFFIMRYRERQGQYRQLSYETTPKPNPEPVKFPVWTFLIPSMCDMTGSTLMYVGLTLTYPSVYQMLRGMIVVFTGTFSFFFLGRKLSYHHFIGMGGIIVGTVLVGLSSVLHGSHDKPAKAPLWGDLFVVAAQIVAATQMVVEEKFIGKFNVPPLQVVGNEGAWGVGVTSLILFILYWIKPVRDYDNSLDALYQIYNGHWLLLAVLGSVFSIAFFNFFGISVTKQLSATHRTTIDATRVFLVWIVSLIMKWEQFSVLQLGGFVILLLGTAVFNEIFRIPYLPYPPKDEKAASSVNPEEQYLLPPEGKSPYEYNSYVNVNVNTPQTNYIYAPPPPPYLSKIDS